MATIFEIANKTGVGVRVLRKLNSAGYLIADTDPEDCEPIRFTLQRQNPLSVAQLVKLIENPSLFDYLGRYTDRAREEVAKLGDIEASAAGRNVTAYLFDAADNQPEAIAEIVQWLRWVLPVRSVSHAWVSLRLIWNLPETLRARGIDKVSLALLNVRRSPEFAGCWHVATVGNRNQSFYHQPPGKVLDL